MEYPSSIECENCQVETQYEKSHVSMKFLVVSFLVTLYFILFNILNRFSLLSSVNTHICRKNFVSRFVSNNCLNVHCDKILPESSSE